MVEREKRAMISIQLQVICVVISFIFFSVTIIYIKKDILNFKYSCIWLVASAICIALSVFPRILETIRLLVGTELAVNALFGVIFCFVLCLLFGLTIIVSKHSNRLRRLNQELAIYKMRIDKNE